MLKTGLRFSYNNTGILFLTAAYLHVARTVVRRAERTTWAALDTYHGGMNPLTATYLNRLSDLLFILSRIANAGDDVLWQPGARP